MNIIFQYHVLDVHLLKFEKKTRTYTVMIIFLYLQFVRQGNRSDFYNNN